MIIGYFQVNLWKIGSIGGAGGATAGVVAFFVTSIFGAFRREAEKIAEKFRSEKSAVREETMRGRFEP